MLDVRRPYAGDALPAHLGDHAALVVLGGSMGANDDQVHPWLTPTKQLVRLAAADGTPGLGICLGHQLAAVALGGTVVLNPAGRQFGVYEIDWEDDAADDPLLGSRPPRGIHWNDDVVSALPDGATALAHAPDGTIQAARFAPRFWGVQLHPEVDDVIVGRWAAEEREGTGPEIAEEALAEMKAAGPDLERDWRPVARVLAELARRKS